MSIPTTVRRVGIAIGIVVLGGGIVSLVIPGVASILPFTMILVDVAALGGLLLGVWIARTRYHTVPHWTTIPDVEFPVATAAPGDEIDESIRRVTSFRDRTAESREQIAERIREVAVSALMQREQCSYEQATTRIEDGSWTDSVLAKDFFENDSNGSNLSIVDRLKQRITAEESVYEKRLRATIDSIEAIGGYVGEKNTTDEADTTWRAMRPVEIVRDHGTQATESVRYLQLVRTHHWAGVSAFAFLAIAAGILSSQPALLLGGAVGIAISGYARLAMPPSLADLEVTRTLSDESPQPGDVVTVTVTVENAGETVLPDLRLIDRIPPTMHVVDGSPRLGTALRPDETATLTYQLCVERGEYSWPLQVLGRDVSGSVEREATIDSEVTVRCVPRLKTVVDAPVRLQTSIYAGSVKTETGGDGLEFFSVRDYQPGDPESRIDWKTYARTGEFTTIDFREERAARTVLLFDARAASYVSSVPGEEHALNKSIDAAFDVFASLYDQGHLVGIAAYNGIPCWLGPGTGALHRQRVRDLFVDHSALSPLPPELAEKEEGRYVDPWVHIRRQLPANTQIFLFSPLTDHYTFEVARRLDGAGHLVTIVSPDPTAGRTVGQRIARLERTIRIQRLRDHGLRVVDWNTDRPLALELEHARRRWRA